MELEKQRVIEKFRREFVGDVPYGEALLAKIERGGWTLTSLRRTDNASQRRPWLLYLEPDHALRARFELAPEVLAIVSPHARVQARELDIAESELAVTHRLDRGLVFFFSNDPDAESELRATLQEERRYLFLSMCEFLAAADPVGWLREHLSERLGSMRPFAPGSPVVDAQFFGRQAELAEIERRLLQTSTPVGLFGLRKVGKTSLLKRLQAQWRSATHPTVMLYCDMQAVPFARRTRAGTFELLWKAAREEAQHLDAIDGGDRWLTAHPLRATDAERLELGTAALESVLAWAEAHGRKLVLAFDEYERLLDGKTMPVEHGLDVLDYVRGLNQQHPKAFTYVVAGLNRVWANTSRYSGRQNPLFGAYYLLPLGGMSREDLGSLIRKLGRRTSLDFDHAAIDTIYAESGGHPFLARTLADRVDQSASVQRRESISVSRELVEARLAEFESDTLPVMQEMADAVVELSPKEGCETLAAALSARSSAGVSAGFVTDLVRYGIIANESFSPRIGVFARWLQRNISSALRAAHG